MSSIASGSNVYPIAPAINHHGPPAIQPGNASFASGSSGSFATGSMPSVIPGPMSSPLFPVDADTLHAFRHWAINHMTTPQRSARFNEYECRMFRCLTLTLRNWGLDYDTIDMLCRDVALNRHLVCFSCQKQSQGHIPARDGWKCGTCIRADNQLNQSSEVDCEEARMKLFSIPPGKRYVELSRPPRG